MSLQSFSDYMANQERIQIRSDVIHHDRDKGEERYAVMGHVLRQSGDDDPENRVMRFRASTPDLDRHHTIVRTEGIDTGPFSTNRIFGWDHDVYNRAPIEHVIGKVLDWEQDSSKFDIAVEFMPEDKNKIAGQALWMVQNGFLSMVSIGFISKAAGYEDVEGYADQVWVYNKSELLEVSLVAIPSNRMAHVIHAYNAAQKVAPRAPVDMSAADFARGLRSWGGVQRVVDTLKGWRPNAR